MKAIMTFIVVIIVLSAIAAMFYGGYLAIGFIWQLYAELDAILRLILISSFAVFLFGCFIIAGALKSAGQSKLKAQLSEAKIDLYKALIGIYEAYFSALQSGVNNSQQDTLLKLEEMNAELSMIAGGAVIETHRKLEQAVQRQESGESLSTLYQQLIKKIRQDLGHTPNLDETKLKFLMINQRSSESTSRKQQASA